MDRRARTPSFARAVDGSIVAFVVAIAAAIRWWVIDRDALWLDEGYSWWDARQPLASLFSRVPECDPHPPLYFATLHGWIAAFGDGTVAMRTLSTLLGLATIVVVYCAAREIDRRRDRATSLVGVRGLASLLFALTPFQVYFSIEARPYALLCFGAALMTWGTLKVVRACDEPPAPAHVPRSAWWLLVVGGAIMVWSNNTSVLFLGALSTFFVGLWIVDRGSRPTMVPVVLAGALIAIVWAPDWPLLLRQSREVTGDFWIAPPTFQNLTFELHNLIGLDVLRATWWLVLGALAGVLLVAVRVGPRWAWTLTALIVLPVAYNLLVSALVSPVLISRAMIGLAPAFAIAIASMAMLLPTRALRALVALGLVVTFGLATARFLHADHVKEPWKPVVARIATFPRSTTILVVPNELVLPLTHEARRRGLQFAIRGVPADYPAIGMDARYPSGKCAPSVVRQDLGAQMRALAGAPEVVLLTRLNNTYDPEQAVAAALKASGFTLRSDDVFQPGDLRIMRFTRA